MTLLEACFRSGRNYIKMLQNLFCIFLSSLLLQGYKTYMVKSAGRRQHQTNRKKENTLNQHNTKWHGKCHINFGSGNTFPSVPFPGGTGCQFLWRLAVGNGIRAYVSVLYTNTYKCTLSRVTQKYFIKSFPFSHAKALYYPTSWWAGVTGSLYVCGFGCGLCGLISMGAPEKAFYPWSFTSGRDQLGCCWKRNGCDRHWHKTGV